MRELYKIFQILCILAMIFPGIMAVYGIFAVIGSIPFGITEFGVNLTVELIMLLILFGLFKLYSFFRKKEKEIKTEKPVKPVVEVNEETKPKKTKIFDVDFKDHPEIKSVLVEIRDYQDALKDKDIRTGAYINEAISQLLELYQDIVSTPLKNTEKGKKLLVEINETLVQIRDSLSEAYLEILEGAQDQTEILITALKNKLASDGLIQSKYDINQFKQNG